MRGNRRNTVVRNDFQPGVTPHPEWRTGGKRQQVRQKIARHVHQIDHGGAIRHRHVHVHAENQQRARQLAHFLHDILVTLAGRNYLVNPRRKRMRTGGGHLQSSTFRGAHQFTARATHVGVQLVHIRADFCADLDDGLMHLALHLLAETGRGRFHQFADVRTQLARRRIDDLEFFFDTNREPVTHESPFRPGMRGRRGGIILHLGQIALRGAKTQKI